MIRYITKSKNSYSIIPREETWFDLDGFVDHHLSTPLSPVARLLLTSDGSMTQMMEALLLATVSMVIVRQEIVALSRGSLELIQVNEGEKALAREAWLTDGKNPLIFAHSLLFTNSAEEESLIAIQEVKKPIGRMVRENSIKTFRDGCRLGIVKSPDIASHLGISPDTDFWGRYYRLTTDGNLSGLIFEIFSPELLEKQFGYYSCVTEL